jgi:uncharacterized protein
MRKVVAWLAVAAFVLVAAALVAGGWYYSDELLPAPLPPDPDYTVAIVEADEQAGTVTFAATEGDLVDLGTVGLRTADGLLLLEGPADVNGEATTRTASLVDGDWPEPDDLGEATVYAFAGDPATTLGLPFETVRIPSELGSLPAWRVVPNGAAADGTWVVLVHGRGGSLDEGNRSLAIANELRLPTLSISVRNDPDAAADPDGVGRYGDTEWQDLQAAIDHLRAVEGAGRFVLVGYSQGASITLGFLRRSPDASLVDGAVLISPLVSLQATLELQARNRGIPDPIIPPLLWSTRLVSDLRAGLDFSQVEHLERASELPAGLPMLVTHGDADTTIPVQPSRDLAAALPDTLTYEEYDGVEHVREWNADRARFEADLNAFLEAVVRQPVG